MLSGTQAQAVTFAVNKTYQLVSLKPQKLEGGVTGRKSYPATR